MTWLQFWLWVASFLISDYFRERLPSQTASGVGDFNIPTATEGRSVPVVVGGTMRIDAPNCIWYGSFLADPKTVTTGIVFKDQETVGYRYRLALQYALGKFRASGITGIWIGDDKIFDHVTDAAGVPQEVVDITRYDLFGGSDSGGGFSGRFRLFNGDDAQPVSAFLRDIAGLDPLPAYRGTCYVMITNTSEVSLEGFGNWVQSTPETLGAYIGDQNQLRYIRIEVQTFDTIANGGLGDTLGLGNDHHFIGPDSNPIEVAYQLYTNDRWGRAFPLSDISLPSFQAAAETCYTEGIGFSLIIDEQTSTGEVQDTIEQHVDGYIGPNPKTGQIEVTLSRQDYTLASEYQATDDNIVNVEKWNKGDWSQTYNRVRIRYVDRAKDWNETHAIQLSPGNRIIQGRTITKELRYQGCHTASVAAALAARANRTLSLPQSSGTVVFDRTAWELRPGSVLSLTSSQAGETDLAVRVTKIELGDGIANALKAEVVADISGPEITAVAEVPPTDFVPPVQVVLPFEVEDQAAFECPFILMRADANPNNPPRITTLGRRKAPSVPSEYEVIRRQSAGVPSGAYTSTDFVTAGFCVVGQLRNNETAYASGNGALSMQVDGVDSESLDGLIGTYSPAAGNFAGVCVISPGLPSEEFLYFDEIVDDLTGVRLENVQRAAMDTTWKNHAAGDRIWFIWTGGMGLGGEQYPIGNNVEMKFLPRSPNDAITEPEATALPIVALDSNTGTRNAKPLTPEPVAFNAAIYPGTVDFNTTTTGLPSPDPDITGLVITPTHRLWRTQDIQFSAQGLDVGGGGLNPDELTVENMRISCWLINLDDVPSGSRGQAIDSIVDQLAPLTSQGAIYNLYFPASNLTSQTNFDGSPKLVGESVNMRIEIETKHSPSGQVANNVSHEPIQYDVPALGPWPLWFRESWLGASFNGIDAATDAQDLGESNLLLTHLGNAQIDNAQGVFGESLELDGTGDAVAITNRPGLGPIGTGNDFTIDFRVRFLTGGLGVTEQVLFGQTGPTGWKGFYWRIDAAGSNLQQGYSSNATDGYFFSGGGLVSFPWSPVVDTWYAVRIVRKGVNWAAYVDGTRIGTDVASFTSREVGVDWTLGAEDAGGTLNNGLAGWLDDFNIVRRAAIDPVADASYTVSTLPARTYTTAHYMLHSRMEGTDLDTTYRTDDPNRYLLEMGATTEIDTAQSKFGTASMRCDGVNGSTSDPTLSDGGWLDETQGLRFPSFDVRADNWFMECHVRFAVLPSGDGVGLIAKYARQSGDGADWAFYINGAGTNLIWQHWNTGQIASVANTLSSPFGSSLAINTWYHFAAERVGDTLNLYFDGNRIGQDTAFFTAVPHVLNGGNGGIRPLTIGRFYSVGSVSRIRALNGWIDEVFMVRAPVYNGAATYTVPTAPRSLVSGTPLRLLWDFEAGDFFATDHGIGTNDLRSSRVVFASSARIQDNRAKFGTTSGVVFGADDAFHFSPSAGWWHLADSDFTLDFWHNADTAATLGGYAFFNHWQETGNNRGFRFAWNDTDDALEFEWTTDGSTIKRAFAIIGTPTLDVWTHYQVTRQGSTLYLFVDGVLQTLDGASDAIGTDVIHNAGSGWRPALGSQDVTGFEGAHQGYFDEIRLTLTAENTSSFTPATAPYPRPTLPNV